MKPFGINMTKYNILDRLTLRDSNTKLEQEVIIMAITFNPTPENPEDKIIYTLSNLQTCNEATLTDRIEEGFIKLELGIAENIDNIWNYINHS